MIDQEYKASEKNDLELRAFLGQYQLPGSFYDLTAQDDIPDAFMKKIEEYQKKGSTQNFTGILSSINGLRENCSMMLKEIELILNQEEQFDKMMRAA